MTMILLIVVFCLTSQIEAQLQGHFYENACPNAEAIIRKEVEKAFFQDNGIAPGLVRMHFHDCFVRGCDASILIKSTPGNAAEEDGPPNAGSLRGFEVIESAKARLEQECSGLVSCADILAFAVRDSVVITGGIGWDVPAGRRDGRISRAEETRDLPSPFHNLNQNTQAFAKKILSQHDMIALLGAHTIGRSHCTSFSNRLYNFSSTSVQDPTLDPFYAEVLKNQCPSGSVDSKGVVRMNFSPTLFDNSYYIDVLMNKGLFTSDQALKTSPDSFLQVQEYALDNIKWQHDFAEAMINLSQIEVLTGADGEIRLDCRAIN